jgi:FtsP/CotA-like multicopper oxidase with cupredoxin domain
MAPTAAAAMPALTPYVDKMPTLVDNAIDATGGGTVNLTTGLISRNLHRDLPATTLFGYLGGPKDGESYLGPVIVAQSGRLVTVNYTNGLGKTDYLQVFTNGGSSYAQFNPFVTPTNPLGEVRILTHLHGAIVAGDDDGNPFATPGAYPSGVMQTAKYPNEQPATLSWYHDHLLGDTRMNVVAGLAGGYLIRDDFDTGSNPLLPSGVHELPIVLQDRQLNADGSLLYPVAPSGPTGTNGPWIGEYFGTLMLVNGKVWPYLNVEPALYRFRVLNGCNARILNIGISTPNGSKSVPMTIIGAEGGLLPLKPTATNRLVMAPAERLDVICDFRQFTGQTLIMKNTNLPTGVVSSPGPTLKTVMQINVGNTASGGPTTIPTSLPRNLAVEALTGMGPPAVSGGSVPGKMITMNEIGPGTPAWKLNLNARPYGDTTEAETVHWKTVEDWYFVNLTPDTHPMHTHLFSFTVMGRYNLDVNGFVAASNTAGALGPNGVSQQDVSTLTPFLKSKLLAPDPEETGFKETVKANPGQVTVVRAKFTPPSTVLDSSGNPTEQHYVHHCHIVEHEDNDMMERVIVQP